MSLRAWLAVLFLLCTCFARSAIAEQPLTDDAATIDLRSAEAAPAGWDSQTPPAAGWVPVTLMDFWDSRWPHHDGVVWYRLRWNQPGNGKPVGLLVDYASMAYALYVNGSLIYRDPQLVEPLSRSWIRPHYFLLDQPVLRSGSNELMIRVSGLSAYQPGLGTVTVGNPERVLALARRSEFVRYGIHWFDECVGAVFGGLFFILWLLRRQDSYYGWYALSTLFSSLYTLNFIVSSPWPFDSSDAWQGLNVAWWFAASVTFGIFLLRYVGVQWRRFERGMLVLAASLLVLALFFPRVAGPYRDVGVLLGALTYYAAMLGFIGYTLWRPRADYYALAASLLIPIAVSVRDLLLYLSIIHGDNMWMAATSPLTIMGMGFALAYRFAVAMRRAENYGVELEREVGAATRALTETMGREHGLALNNARITERLNLVRDLHDGFGGSLLGAIGTLEDPRRRQEPAQVVAVLKELRDDLRLVIDTTTHEQDTHLGGQIAPLRHRWSQRLEAADIDSRWSVEGVDQLNLGAMRVLELLRFLQEALTNVLKHSRASQVHVRIHCEDDKLSVDVRDDGLGFVPNAAETRGAGLPSLRARATRLGASLCVASSPGDGTHLSFIAPIAPQP
ncbi:sensor histidine kinase [Dyella mobilis]|uniref:Histidine kinase n=1 Tax=Dyella mobilis TaxID=1849582 RepID=A0ABS2KFK3_9GAMM|nr:ATP-binding protein [Dyella mobilis]MBM7129939.1 histidine kinase [Dyella mobilis]GLQ97798.1 sensor histidine kinase [Dyella mobilis]